MNSPKNLLSFFNEEPIVGLDIDKDCIRAASAFLNKEGKVIIDKLGSLEYGPSASDEEIASVIRKLWKAKHLKTHTVQSCLRSQSIIIKYFKYPTALREEVDSALRLEAEQVFQKPPEEIFIDWHLYSSNNQLNKEKQNFSEGVLVAALAKDINKHLSILEMADLYPVIVDVGCMAITNLFLALNNYSKDDSVCLVNVDSHFVDVSVIFGNYHISPSNMYSQSVSWQEKIDYLSNYIIDVLRYHQYKLGNKPVKKIIFTGSACPQIQLQNIGNTINLPIEFWNPLESSNIENKVIEKDINGFAMATCLGMALKRA